MSKRRNTGVVDKCHVKPDGDYLKENDYGQDTDNNSGAAVLTRRQNNKQQNRLYESIHIEDLLTVNGDVAGAASVDEATVVSPKMEHGAESTPVDGAEPEQHDNDLCPGETMGNDMIVEENCVYESLGAATSQFAV